jgi:flagellar basal-body rod modification protein FlgD
VQSTVDIAAAGQQAIDLKDFKLDPPLKGGKYTYQFEVATDGGQFSAVKTYTTGRITGLRYEQGNPILIIGDSLSVPMSKLTQIRA